MLVNGHRINNADVNSIPANAIERIEVLTDGASSVYGSDAIGGVVNFILRSNYQGAEFSTDYGISDRDDGQRQGYHFLFGQSTDKGSIMAGVDYNKFDSVLASNRDFSKNAIYYYYGSAHVAGGSSRTPTSQVQLPPGLATQFGCASATKTSLGLSGSSLGDYKCYTGADGYNFQAHGNVELTPQERTNAFVLGNYKLTDSVETYLEVYHNKTQSASQIAPQPIDTLGSPLVIAANNYYNPFGVEFSNDANRLKTRSVGNGNRVNNFSTTTDQVVAGFKGTIGETSWQWNAYFNYGHTSQLSHTSGYINLTKLGNGLGPSYKDASGNIVCGTDPALGGSGPVDGCTPVNFFDITAPGTIAALNSASGNTFTNGVFWEKSEVGEVNGTLFDLPAGAVQLAAGVSHRKDFSQTIPDAIEIPDPANDFICDIGTGCVSPLSGSFNGQGSLRRGADPDPQGRTVCQRVEPDHRRPLLALQQLWQHQQHQGRAGIPSDRRPAVAWHGVEGVPCTFRYRSVPGRRQRCTAGDRPLLWPGRHNAACVGVPGDGSFQRLPGQTSQINGILSGSEGAGYNLTPEFGKSFDYGFVYDPHWISGLSLSSDLWRVYLNNEISTITAQNALTLCFQQNGGPTCPLIHRTGSGQSAGQISFIQEPTGNLGRLDASGVRLRGALPSAGNVSRQLRDQPAGNLPG